MARILQAFTQLVPGLLLGVALSLPLHAQLDPRLQGSATDFLDLYQQASTLKAKPEIATIFDFSGSMQCLMYHPCYYNNDPNDNGDTSGITFTLTGTGTPGDLFVVKAMVGDKSWGYTNGQLIRPDGSVVTADLVNSTPTGGLYGDKLVTGASSQACDVRNWVRAASHVRLKKTIGSRVRTIDLPIPWKVIDPATGLTDVPVKSLYVKDEYTYTDPATGLSTSGGTGSDIEIDTRYKIQTGFPDNDTRDNNIVLSGGSDQAVTKTKYMLRLSQLYIDWLFAGTYQNTRPTENDYNTTLNGQFIVFDAFDPANVGLQTDKMQGQGFGSKWDSDAQKAAAQRANVLPARDRVQAVKEAAIRTWIKFQDRVFWAFRCLDDVGEAGNGLATTINGDSSTVKNTADATTTWVNGNDTGWTVLNGASRSVPGMNRIAALFPYTNTPLCYATARALAQFTQATNVFTGVETGKDAPVACQEHFLIIFTDGVPTYDYNSQNQAGSPYIAADGLSGSAQAGNALLIGSDHTTTQAAAANMNPGQTWWNIFTYAGAAAHLADDGKTGLAAAEHPITSYMTPITSPTTSSSPSAFLPFAIKTRGAVDLAGVHRLVTTMTVGVSLGGHVSDAGSPKRRLFLAAAVGDPNRTYWDVNPSSAACLTPYTLKDPDNVSLGKTDNSTYFFDATSPDLLTKSLDAAFSEAAGSGNAGVTSNPNLPFIGASVSKQIYLGKFIPPKSGGVFWSGDLLMFPTKIDNQNETVILDNSGKAITGAMKLDSKTATWSAANSLPLWSARHLKTRLPNASSLSAFTYTDTALQNVVAMDHKTAYPAGSTAQLRLIKLAMGADTTKGSLPNRSNIMGDIIDSSPAYLEYNTSSLSGTFQTGERFRLILVGTNQGWLHAFGERTTISSVDDPDSTTTPKAKMDLVSGTVSELWAFMPTDFLANLDYLDKSTNTHKFMVDGSPSIYFLDLPPSGGGTGNGLLDGANVDIDPIGDTTHERAIAIIGLRKGGRSYYALNLHDPSAPTLQWSLVPDEATNTNLHARNDTGLDDGVLATIIQNMGYSTSTPSFGRVLFNGVYKDVVFFGGGLSLPEIEAKFTGSPLMGRSVLALDVNNGHFLAVVDLTINAIGGKTSGGAKTMIGPIATGVVPFEFFLGSGMAQRAYFTDLWGGLWCWGSKATVPGTAAYRNFRKDTSDLQAWSSDGNKTKPYGSTGIRKVYQDENSSVTATALNTTPVTYSYTFTGPTYTTLPSPFLVGTFPGKGHIDAIGPASAPVAVGVAMESGNRNDPLDYGTNPAPPLHTRLTVIFDRQDSRAWGLDTAAGPDAGIQNSTSSDDKLLNAGNWNDLGAIGTTLASTDASIRPGNSYYLAPATQNATMFGYYVTFPGRVADGSIFHYSKGINTPMAVSGSLFYSYFTPTTADVCSGGEGFTYSNKICDLMNPVVKDVGTGLFCASGNVDKWVNVASDFSLLGAPGVQQAGTRSTTDASGNTTTKMDTNTYLGQSQARFPKARVWRTVR